LNPDKINEGGLRTHHQRSISYYKYRQIFFEHVNLSSVPSRWPPPSPGFATMSPQTRSLSVSWSENPISRLSLLQTTKVHPNRIHPKASNKISSIHSSHNHCNMDRTIVYVYLLHELVASVEVWMVRVLAASARIGIYGSPTHVLSRLVRHVLERRLVPVINFQP